MPHNDLTLAIPTHPEPTLQPTSGRKTFDTRITCRPELPYGATER